MAPPLLARTRAVVRTLGVVAQDRELWRELAPLALPLAVAPWLNQAVAFFEHGHVFRDTNMFDYAAWCMLHGERLYQGVATPDGPLVYILHAALRILRLLAGGSDDSTYRRIDLVMETLVAVTITLLVTPRASTPRFVWVRRGVWAVMGATFWLGQMVAFDFPASTQRESFYVTLGMLGTVLVYASADFSRRAARWMLWGGAYVVGWLAFGKQTQLIWSAVVLGLALVLPDNPDQPRRFRAGAVAGGIALAFASALAFVAAFGSLRGYWFWCFRYNFLYYQFHDALAPHDILTEDFVRDYFLAAALSLAAGVSAGLLGILPARGVVLSLVPMVNVIAAIAQVHGWRYHFVPAAFSATFFLVYALGQAWAAGEVQDERRAVFRVYALGLLLFVSWLTIPKVLAAPWLHESEEHRGDPVVTEPHDAGRLLATLTRPEDRVFYFGDDPATPLEARRLPATPFIVAWMWELHRGAREGYMAPSPPVLAARDRMQEALVSQACGVLLAAPPAVAIRDDSVGFKGKGLEYVTKLCPDFANVLAARYRPYDVGSVHLYIRDDRP